MVLPASAFPMSTFPFQNQPVHPFLAAAVTQPGGTNLFPMFGPLKVEPHAWGIISGATEDPRSGSPGSSMSSLSPIQLTPSPSENGDAALSPPPTNPHAAAPVAPTSRPCSTVSEPAQGSSPLPHSLTNLLAPAPRTSTPALPPIKQEGCPNVTLTPQLVPFSSTSEFQPYFVPSFQFPVPHYNYVPPPPGPWDFSWAQPKQEPTPAQPPTAPIRPGRTRTREKYRMVYTDFQRLELEKEFHSSKYITTARKTQLAQSLGLTDRQIKIWFQNRRAKHRKKGNMINPPTNLSALNQHSLNVKEQIQQVESPVLPDSSTSAEAIRFERLQPMEGLLQFATL